MHTAISATSVVSGRREPVDSILVHAGQLLLGGPHSSLASYVLPERTANASRDQGDPEPFSERDTEPQKSLTLPSWTVRLSNKPKTIEQLHVIREANLLVTLSDAQVSLHDLASILNVARTLTASQRNASLASATLIPEKACTPLIQTKGALSLALDTSIQRAPAVSDASGNDGWGAGYRHRAGRQTIGRAYRPSDTTMGRGSGTSAAASLRGAERPLSLLGMDDIRRNKEQQRRLGLESLFDAASNDDEGVMSIVSTLAIGCRRKIIVFRWVDGAFWDTKEVSLAHTPRSLAFPSPTTVLIGYSAADFALLSIPLAAASSVADLLKAKTSTASVTIPSTSVAGSRVDLYEWKVRQLTVPAKTAPLDSDEVTSNNSTQTGQAQSDTLSAIPQATSMAAVAGAFSGLGGYIGMSSRSLPRILQIEGAEVLVCRDALGIFLNDEGRPTRREGIEWQSIPEEVAYVKPYILSILPPTQKQSPSYPLLQVRSAGTLVTVQTLPFPPLDGNLSKAQMASIGNAPNVRLLTASPNGKAPIYVKVAPTERGALEREGLSIWCLEMKSWGRQIDELVAVGEFQEALALLHSVDEVILENKADRQTHIETLYAVSLFQRDRFDEAIERFIELNTNPSRVIAMYPKYISGPLATDESEWLQLFGGPSPKEIADANSEKASSHKSPLQPSAVLAKDVSDTASIRSVRSSTAPSARERSRLANFWGRKTEIESSQQDSALKEAETTSTPKRTDDGNEGALLSDSGREAKLSVQSSAKLDIASLPTGPTTERDRASIDALGRFLADRRRIFKPILETQPTSHSITLSQTKRDPKWLLSLPSESLENLNTEHLTAIAQVVDTALFKTFLATKPGLLGPLCRVENWCEVQQVEELLMSRQRYSELISLYGGKEMHDKALNLLRKMSDDVDDVEDKVMPTIRYLQNLGPSLIDTILEASHWVLSLDADLGMDIFCADTGKVASLPRHAIVADLEQFSEELCIRFLSHLVDDHGESDPHLHEKMAYLLLRRAEASSTSTIQRQEALERLHSLLDTSQQYRAERVLHRVPAKDKDFYDIRALLLGRLGQDEAALRIYVDRLHNHAKAEEYCKRIRASRPESKVFLTLLEIYLRPRPSLDSDKKRAIDVASSMQIAPALSIIARYGSYIDATAALDLLPPHLPLASVSTFASKTLQQSFARRSEALVVSQLRNEYALQVDEEQARLHRRRVKVTETRTCPRCMKRLGNSVIAVTSHGAVLHYGCSRRE